MYDFTDEPVVNIYELKDGKISTILTDSYGEKIGTISVEKKNGKIIADSDVVKEFTLRIYDADKKVKELNTKNGRIEV